MFNFVMQVAQNPYFLRDDETALAQAAISLDSDFPQNTPAHIGERKLAEAFILDCSASMSEERFNQARAAIKTAISILDEKCYFCIIAGRERARVAFKLTQSTPFNRNYAYNTLDALKPLGGTAMSTWLDAALGELAQMPHAIRHAILLTDGKNEDDRPGALFDTLIRCESVFQCDARGVGTDWDPAQLRLIAERLLGTADIIPKAQDIEKHFRQLIETVRGKLIANLSFRVWVPMGSSISFVRQAYPYTVDLTDRGVVDPASPQLFKFPTGAWGREKRDFHVGVRIRPRNLGLTLCAGRFSAVTSWMDQEARLADAVLQAILTDDKALIGNPAPAVKCYAEQHEMALAIQKGLEARANGDFDEALELLGRAVRIASASNPQMLKLLGQVVEIQDARLGAIKLNSNFVLEDEFALNTRSTRTARAKWGAEPAKGASTNAYQPRVEYYKPEAGKK